MTHRFFATASRGTEDVLADELRELGASGVEERRGGVAFAGSLEVGYRACLWSRVASRVLLPLAEIDAPDSGALYAGVHAIDWTAHVGPERTLAVDVAGANAPAGPPRFVALKTKDAIVDRVREAEGARPDVDTENPDLRVHVHLDGARVTISLDLAGRGLHRRGIGRGGAAAPLKENLAAAILRIAGWPARAAAEPLVDPLCGSGTLLVEAAWIALDVAPGLARPRIGAEGWRGHDAKLWERLRHEAHERRAAARARTPRLAGADASPSAVTTARENLRRAGVEACVRLERRELREAVAPWPGPGLVVTNPPYGARLGEAGELGPLYELLGDVLKRRFPGFTAWVLSGNRALDKRLGLRPSTRRVLHNGPIECRLLELPIGEAPVAGESGPAWRRAGEDAAPFARKLEENRGRLARWVEREGLEAYRVYDADITVWNLAVDLYGAAARVEEYARPGRVAPEVAERRLRDARLVVAEVLSIAPEDVVLRVRRRRAPGEQPERRDDRGERRAVREGDLRFLVNLTDYLDTGLFLDDRLLRRRMRERARDADVLNLFAYTCAATVAAAAGGARSTTSVDLSAGYLAWGRENLALNGHRGPEHRFVRADATAWLARGGDRRRYGLVHLAPPTHSRSKAMRDEMDIERDHARLIRDAARLLAPGGELLFSTHRRDFELDRSGLPGLEVEEVTDSVTPLDFARRPRMRAWAMRAATR